MENKYWTEITIIKVRKECLEQISLEVYLALIILLYGRDVTGTEKKKTSSIKWRPIVSMSEEKKIRD